jgi:hypothetical protein
MKCDINTVTLLLSEQLPPHVCPSKLAGGISCIYDA